METFLLLGGGALMKFNTQKAQRIRKGKKKDANGGSEKRT